MGIENRLSDASRRTGYSEEYSDWRDLCRDGLSAIHTLKGKLDAAEARAIAAEAEVARLRGLLQWCRPRLRRTEYQFALDRYVAEGTASDHTPIVQSATPSQPDAIRKAVEAPSFWVVELIEDRRAPCLRYWGGAEAGFVYEIREALQFMRQQDADRFLKGSRIYGRAAEHAMIGARSPAAQTGEPQ